MNKKINLLVIITGLVVGVAAVVLTKLGNPKNMGFCIACFIRDIAGSLKLHNAGVVQYFRPEIFGIILGALIAAISAGEWRAKAGSSPVTRFALGFMVMVGALVFLGCPLRMVIRMGGGDLNAFVGFIGFIVGIVIGVVFLKKGFSLKRNYDVGNGEGFVLPVAFLIIFVILIGVGYYTVSYLEAAKAEGAKPLFAISLSGPGSMHASFIVALIVAVVVGFLAQKSRLCMVGGIRDIIMFKNPALFLGFVGVFVAVFVGNIIFGNFKGFSTMAQPISHSSQIWNFLGMVIVGWGSALLGGCPLRQLILAGEGNADSAITILGMLIGAAFAHNFSLAGGADTIATADIAYKVGGIGFNGQVITILILVILLVISIWNTFITEKTNN